MFHLKQNDLFWNGRAWTEDWRRAIVYGSAAAAIAQAPNDRCIATGLNIEAWEAFLSGQLRSLDRHRRSSRQGIVFFLREPLYLNRSARIDAVFTEVEIKRRERTYSVWIQKRIYGRKISELARSMQISGARIHQIVSRGDRCEAGRPNWRKFRGLIPEPATEGDWQYWTLEMLGAFAAAFSDSSKLDKYLKTHDSDR